MQPQHASNGEQSKKEKYLFWHCVVRSFISFYFLFYFALYIWEAQNRRERRSNLGAFEASPEKPFYEHTGQPVRRIEEG